MRIQKVILASDTKRFYLEFWPSVSRIWKEKFHIHPVLLLFGDRRKCNVSSTYGDVVEVEPIPDVPTHLQAQWSRYWFPSTEPGTIWITSDIDMYPISRHYFIDLLNGIPEDRFVVLNSRGNYFPACYNVGTGACFKEVLRLPASFETSMQDVLATQRAHGHDHTPEGLDGYEKDASPSSLCQWGIDEARASLMIRQYPRQERIVRVTRPGGFCARRLDRTSWHYSAQDIEEEYYLDCHCPRPYSTHRTELEALVQQILHGERRQLQGGDD